MKMGIGFNLRQRSSAVAFNPVSLAPSVLYDPSDMTTLFQSSAGTTAVAANADPIGYLGDKSGNAKHMIQATAGSRPVLSTAGGLKSVKFDGVDDFLSGPLSSDVITAAAFDIIVAGRFNSVATDSAAQDYTNDAIFADLGAWFTVGARSSGAIRVGVNGDAGGNQQAQAAYTVGTPAVIHFRLSGGILSVTVNGGTTATAAASNVGSIAGVVGIGKANSAGTEADLDFYAMFARKTILSAGELASVKTWAGAKAGVTL